jgi:fructosamine-3-kinase
VDDATRVRLELLLDSGLQEARALGGQHGVGHYRLTLADGRAAFAKVALPAALPSARPVALQATGRAATAGQAGFAAEAAGLRWLASLAAVPVPEVLAADDWLLVIEWIAAGGSDPQAAARFGADLAGVHGAGAEHFGAPWPGVIAGLPLPNDEADDWPTWYGAQRLLPYARLARDSGAFTAADVRLVESVVDRIADVAGLPEPPSRIHGDCWSGNVMWSRGRGWLIDPAAHGGHRESDLAMLALFGAPYLSQILAAYQEVAPLADGWRDRVPLHQLHPLLVHVCLFGNAYRDAALNAARAVLMI